MHKGSRRQVCEERAVSPLSPGHRAGACWDEVGVHRPLSGTAGRRGAPLHTPPVPKRGFRKVVLSYRYECQAVTVFWPRPISSWQTSPVTTVTRVSRLFAYLEVYFSCHLAEFLQSPSYSPRFTGQAYNRTTSQMDEGDQGLNSVMFGPPAASQRRGPGHPSRVVKSVLCVAVTPRMPEVTCCT